MSEWLRVDPLNFIKAAVKNVGGVQVNTVLSPYDVPDAVRSDFDSETDRCTLEFAYGGRDERMHTIEISSNISLVEGERSGRLYRILVRPVAPGKRCTTTDLESVMKALADARSESPSWRKAINFDVAKDILQRNEKLLVAKDD